MTVPAIRSRIEDGSGTAADWAWNPKLLLVPPSDFVDVKLQLPSVGSKLLPLIMPVPVTSRKVELCDTTIEELKSKVKPPIIHNAGVAGPGAGVAGVPELNVHDDAIVAGSPGSIE